MSDSDISRFHVPTLDEMPDDIRELIKSVSEKSGFVPNVFVALAARPEEFRSFFALHDTLMDKSEGLSKAERELIVVATSAVNECMYCVIAHGAILRIRSKTRSLPTRLQSTPPRRRSASGNVTSSTSRSMLQPIQQPSPTPRSTTCVPKVSPMTRSGTSAQSPPSFALQPPCELCRNFTKRRVLRNGALKHLTHRVVVTSDRERRSPQPLPCRVFATLR